MCRFPLPNIVDVSRENERDGEWKRERESGRERMERMQRRERTKDVCGVSGTEIRFFLWLLCSLYDSCYNIYYMSNQSTNRTPQVPTSVRLSHDLSQDSVSSSSLEILSQG